MPLISEVVKFESEAPPHTIRLIKNNGFFRAYNHSAWLFICCIADHKVMRKYIKSLKADVLYVGFPETSLLNNIENRRFDKTEFGIDIELREDERPDEEGYQTWLSTVETLPSSKGDFNSLPPAGADAEREVIMRLRDFPLESKSMVECAVFLAELRKILSNR